MQAFMEECTKAEYESKHPALKNTPELLLVNAFAPKNCGHCGSKGFVKRGFTANGIQRYKCLSCGKTFNVLTGTVFDSHKISLTEWLGFLLDIFGFGSFSLTSKGNRNSINTTKYWTDKVFMLLEGSQDTTMLENTVWIDEKFYTLRAPDIKLKPDGTKYRGLSRNQMCIGVGCDDRGHEQRKLDEGIEKARREHDLETARELALEAQTLKRSNCLVLSSRKTLLARDEAAREHNRMLHEKYGKRGLSIPANEHAWSVNSSRRLNEMLASNERIQAAYVFREMLQSALACIS